MRIPSDPDGTMGEPFSELLRLQTDFYTRLTEETLRYLRRVQGAAAPAVPGTVLMPSTAVELGASGAPGTSIELKLEVENRQRMHCVVTPMLSPMVDSSGVTWFPAAEAAPPSLLLAPAEVATLVIRLPLPGNIPPGAYRGALLLQGFREGAVAVTITVIGDEPAAAASDAIATAIETISTPRPSAKPRRGRKGAEQEEDTPKRSRRTPGRQS